MKFALDGPYAERENGALERDGSSLNRLRIPQIGKLLIQHAGWEGGQHGWDEPIRTTFVSGWWGLSSKAACRGIRRQPNLGIGISTAINWVQRFHETGSVKPDQIGGYRPKKIAGPHREWLTQRKSLETASFLTMPTTSRTETVA
jgi:hypothetical protein